MSSPARVAAAARLGVRSLLRPAAVSWIGGGLSAPIGGRIDAACVRVDACSLSGRWARALHASEPAFGRRSQKIAGRKEKSSDAKAKLYGKLGKLIAQAVRTGGASMDSNERLRDVLAQAKAAKLPQDIIERNLKRAADKDSAAFSEVVYECYGPGGTGFVIECLTDNSNRANAGVRTAVSKNGGKMADAGSVLFSFERRGRVAVGPGADEDAVLEAALEAGANEVEPREEGEGATADDRGVFDIWTAATSFGAVRDALQASGLPILVDQSGLAYCPLVPLTLDDDTFAANENLVEKLLELDDVDAVYSNCDGLDP